MSPRAAILVGLLAAFLFGTTAGLVGGFVLARGTGPGWGPFAGAPGPGGPRFDRGMPRPPRAVRQFVERELQLTPEQSEQFRAALERQRARMDAVHDSVRAEMDRVLTPEQRERWKQMDAKWRRGGPGRRGGRMPRLRDDGPVPGGPMGAPADTPPGGGGR